MQSDKHEVSNLTLRLQQPSISSRKLFPDRRIQSHFGVRNGSERPFSQMCLEEESWMQRYQDVYMYRCLGQVFIAVLADKSATGRTLTGAT